MFRTVLLFVLVACREPAEAPEAAPEATEAAPEVPAATAPEAPPVAEPAPETPPAAEPEPATTGKADGASCLASSECASGICEGEGCGDDQPGTCMTKMRACTRDRRPYCGCDGQTFETSGSCPGRRFAHRGACEP